MKPRAGFLLLAALAGCAGGAATRQKPDAAQALARALQPGWRMLEAPRVYTGADLFGLINGGAELYLELGFQRLERVTLASGEDRVTLELYTMADSLAALGAFFARCGRAEPLPELGPHSAAAEGLVQFARGHFLAAVYDASRTPGAARALPGFALRLAAGLPAESDEATLRGLIPQDALPGTLRVIRGPFTLQTVTSMLPPTALALGEAGWALAYDTPMDQANATRILAHYPCEQAARHAFERLAASLAEELDVRVHGDARLNTARILFSDGFEHGQACLSGTTLDLLLHLPEAPRE